MSLDFFLLSYLSHSGEKKKLSSPELFLLLRRKDSSVFFCTSPSHAPSPPRVLLRGCGCGGDRRGAVWTGQGRDGNDGGVGQRAIDVDVDADNVFCRGVLLLFLESPVAVRALDIEGRLSFLD